MDRTEAVLRWLDAILTKADGDPLVLLQAKKEIDEKKELIKEAIEDALLDEFKPYAELITKLLSA